MKREKQKSKPRLFRQEKFYTCAVACLRMLLDFYDHEIDEASLATICRTDFYGTTADNIVLAAQELGFKAQKEYCSIGELQSYLDKGFFQFFLLIFLRLMVETLSMPLFSNQ